MFVLSLYRSITVTFEEYGAYYDLVFIARVGVAQAHIDDVKTYCPNARVIFDTEDLHFVGEERRAELENDAELAKKASQRKAEEYRLLESLIARLLSVSMRRRFCSKRIRSSEWWLYRCRAIFLAGWVDSTKEGTSCLLAASSIRPMSTVCCILCSTPFHSSKNSSASISFYILGSNPPR